MSSDEGGVVHDVSNRIRDIVLQKLVTVLKLTLIYLLLFRHTLSSFLSSCLVV